MTGRRSTSQEGRTLTVRVPLTMRKRGGRKQVVAPNGANWAPTRTQIDNTMVKAIARAFRWRKMLETGTYGTIDEIAKAEEINSSYISRVLRLTLLAPEIVESVLDGRQPHDLTLARVMELFPIGWPEQRAKFPSR